MIFNYRGFHFTFQMDLKNLVLGSLTVFMK